MPSRIDLAKIHIAKKELGLTDEEYRDILYCQYRKKSSKDLTPGQAWKLLAYFKNMGWKPKQQSALPGMSVPNDGQSKKIQALWITLNQAGIVKNGSNKAMMAFVKRITKKDQLKWCDSQEKNRVIEALKEWAARKEVTLG